ncbi:alternate-type signal peptide domain-containing protein [Leucobacter coleopterorum]|uniref:Alternate-type signal peptide domain-containing protein n=1 Tax=Leucobacter coleopterorum TaxID=2714933 RepID=A0ABX6JWN6_9MICO|nr:alternate-type signal peptide domain-containing protein [Leucobacter coleopterorum]QIM18717.1 alternate-type signal peptide domain-containing protein [Leucobacter coleopterorum]
MNKLSKGLIVSGLGVLLLLGTGGSLALWNVSASSEAGQIVTGDLNLSIPTEDQVWETVDAEGTWTPISNISDYTIVPGKPCA